tara:strand:- start:4429 stop:4641 length:213 start_codon:yes stop_codon:yes gene_type:complete
MLQGIRILITIIANMFLIYLITFAFAFLNIGFDVYGCYLVWFIALPVFWALLPEETGEVFSIIKTDTLKN